MNRIPRLSVAVVLAVAAAAAWRWSAMRPPDPSPRANGPVRRQADPAPRTRFKVSAPPPPAVRTAPGPEIGAITAFDQWLTATLRPGHAMTAVETAAGIQLAHDRRAVLKTLIASDPREALAHAISLAARQQLPAEIARELETPVNAFGRFEVLTMCGPNLARTERWTTIGNQTYATYTYGARLGTLSKARLPVHGIAIDDALAMSEFPYAALELPAASAADAGAAITVAVGDTTRRFPSTEALQAWAEQAQAAEQAPNPNAATAAALTAGWTTGEKSVLWIRAEFPDDAGSPASDDQINAAMAAADAFYRDVSHDTCSLKPTILPGTVKLLMTKTAYAATSSGYLTLRADALQLARDYDAANGATGKYNPDNYDRYIVLTKDVSNWTWSGMATVGNKGLSLNGDCNGALTAHELGHNQGLRHSHAWAPSAGTAIGAGTHIEYGDAFDDMGSGQQANFGGHFNVVQKYTLGYLTDSSVQTITQSGTYRIYRHDDRAASGIQALKIATANAGTNYWLEYRHASPYPQFATPVTGSNELPRLQNGIVFHWDKGPSFTSGPGTYLLDMTPTTTSGVIPPTDPLSSTTHLLDDAALAVGETFTDPATNLVVTPLQVGGTAPNEWIDVHVSLDVVTGNHSPTLAASAPTGIVEARTNTTISASATDADGDPVYYHWDFGDGSVAPATATLTHRWLVGGTYTVTCTATDGRGGNTTTTFSVNVEDPLLNWQRQAPSLTTSYFTDVLFDGTKFVAVGIYVGATSTNGIDWTLAIGMSHDGNYGIAYGGGRYVAVGKNPLGTTITTSTDGLTWTDLVVSASVPPLTAVAYGAGRFVAVGQSGTILTSTDGLTWMSQAAVTTNELDAVRYAAGRFVAAGKNATFLVSADGLNWQDASVSGETSGTVALVYFANRWLAVTTNNPLIDPAKLVAWTSADGSSWSKIYLHTDVPFKAVVPIEDGKLLLGVGISTNGTLSVAEDPNGPWTPATLSAAVGGDAGSFLSSAAEGNGVVVVVGFEGRIYTPLGRPFVATPPAATTVTAGGMATFDATGYATGPFTFQWLKNGIAINGATNSTYAVANVGTADVANYSAILSNGSGSATTAPAQLLVTSAGPTVNPSRLANVSIRSIAGTGDQTLIVGVSVGGGADGVTKPLLVRAVGPTLAGYGITNALAAPVLGAYRLGATDPLATNDCWQGDVHITAVAKAVSAFPLDATSDDAALYRSFDSGGYTMQVTGNSGTGVALVEVYDATGTNGYLATTPRLLNVSARTQVGTGNDVLIVGFSITGDGPKRLLIRAVGPTLAKFVGGTLANPELELRRQDTGAVLMQNDDWNNDSAIADTAHAIGAFPLDAGSKDAALLIDLQPGTYSVVVRGVGDTMGVALAEVYEIQ